MRAAVDSSCGQWGAISQFSSTELGCKYRRLRAHLCGMCCSLSAARNNNYRNCVTVTGLYANMGSHRPAWPSREMGPRQATPRNEKEPSGESPFGVAAEPTGLSCANHSLAQIGLGWSGSNSCCGQPQIQREIELSNRLFCIKYRFIMQ